MFSERFASLKGAIAATEFSILGERVEEGACLERIFSLLETALEKKGIVYVIGNGGSAGIASHFSSDLLKALEIPSQTFYDSNLLTCLGNDYGYPEVFSYPLSKLGKEGDLLVAISSSGKSPNILNAAKVAQEKGIPILSLSGFSPSNPLRSLGTVSIFVDRKEYGLVETAHFFFLHALVDLWGQKSRNKERVDAPACLV